MSKEDKTEAWVSAITLATALALILSIVAAGLSLGALSKSSTAFPDREPPQEEPIPDGSVVVTIPRGAWDNSHSDPNHFYRPNKITIEAGTTVTWVNEDIPHTVTAEDGSFDSDYFDEGQHWSYTFTEPGVYHYYCKPHRWMTGTVVVVDPEASGNESPREEEGAK